MSSLVVWTLLLTSFLPETFGYAVARAPRTGDNRTTKPLPLLQPREDGDPTDYSWVKSLAAIGDSFTAGIGAGKNVGGVYDNKKANGDRDSYSCSRYDLSYPMLVNRVIGPSVKEFQFPACSGDRSGKIFDQVNALKENIDMVVMTAGGNDLCLAAMIRKCVILPYGGEETCNAVIKKAEENIDKILKDNIKQILIALNDKMAEGGVVVYNGYAQYFNTETNDCADKQHWEFARWLPFYWFQTPLRLTIERRERFNKLVRSINTAIREALYTLHDEGSLKYEIGFSNWDPWVRDGVNGQMCDPSSSGKYPDSDQPDLQFFKPSTNPIAPHDPNQLRRRKQELDYRIGNRTLLLDKDGVDPSIYDTLLWKSPAPAAEVLHKLDKRAPAPPGCPGDGDIFSGFFSNHITDDIGRLFHPNELGHETIASFALAKGIDLRAKVLDQAPQACDVIVDDFKCWQNEGRTGYATSDRMNENIEAFCSTDISVPDHEVGWRSEATYHEGTPDEHTFVLQMGEDVGDFDIDRCRESFDRIVNSCDGNDPENPMNWKFGGKWQRDSITYEINVKRDNRPWPPIKEPWGKCKGDYKALFGSYSIQGAGFSSWEWGQKTLLSSARSCVGGGITNWKFEYFDQPDEDGNEWSATFRTPIWVRNRCFKNNKVAFASGGFTNGCKGSD